MRLVRFHCMGRNMWGHATDEGIRYCEGSPYEGEFVPTDTELAWEAVQILPPCTPTKIVCVGSNYASHCREMGRDVPEVPKLFLKPPSALIGHEAFIRMPGDVGRVDYEGELAVVIGRRGHAISEESVNKHVLGYTILNDVTARDIQRSDVQFTRAKGFDTFCPIGPWLVRDVDPNDLRISTVVNGETRQDARTSDMVFSPARLVSFISSVMTLEAGDVVSTGTPSGVAPLRNGDCVDVTIEGIGTLRNEVRVM